MTELEEALIKRVRELETLVASLQTPVQRLTQSMGREADKSRWDGTLDGLSTLPEGTYFHGLHKGTVKMIPPETYASIIELYQHEVGNKKIQSSLNISGENYWMIPASIQQYESSQQEGE